MKKETKIRTVRVDHQVSSSIEGTPYDNILFTQIKRELALSLGEKILEQFEVKRTETNTGAEYYIDLTVIEGMPDKVELKTKK